jgi:hypothetical protein
MQKINSRKKIKISKKQKSNSKTLKIDKNISKQSYYLSGGVLTMDNVVQTMRKPLPPKNGDILLADNGFVATFNGNQEKVPSKNDIKYFHDNGFAWGSTYDRKWIIITRENYEKITARKKQQEKAEQVEKERFDESMFPHMAVIESKVNIIKNIYEIVLRTGLVLNSPSFIKNPRTIFPFTTDDAEKKFAKIEDKEFEHFSLDFPIEELEKPYKGWTVYAPVHEDYYSWIESFEAYKNDEWVIGDFNYIVYSSSKAAFDDFTRHFRPTIFNSGDI